MDLLPQIITCIIIIFQNTIHTSFAHRLSNSDSILDIINTENVQKLIAERRQNSSRHERRYHLKNDLDEHYPETRNNRGDVYQTPDISFNTYIADHHGRGGGNGAGVGGGGGGGGGFNGERRRNRNRNRRPPPSDILLSYNDTAIPNTDTNPDILQDLQSFRAEKLLKSSKNALIVTRKEYLKKDWCKTEPLVQRIHEEGCLSKPIINRFCYGQCNSFYIPKSPKKKRYSNPNLHGKTSNGITNFEDEDLTEAVFRSCAFCKPKKFTWITVTLRCPSLVPQLRKKRIQRIKQCKCIAEPLN